MNHARRAANILKRVGRHRPSSFTLAAEITKALRAVEREAFQRGVYRTVNRLYDLMPNPSDERARLSNGLVKVTEER